MSGVDDFDPEQFARDSAEFFRRVIELAPDQELSSGLAEWRDAIVFLTEGEIELVCVEGERRRFPRGAMLCVTPKVRLLRNSGVEPARLIVISRRDHVSKLSG
jgi:quercetin dioxygenase-like cupin family protein